METKKFNYVKEDNTEVKEVAVLWQDEKYVEGIDVSKLNEEEMEQLEETLKENKERLKPFFKGYRKYKREKIISDELPSSFEDKKLLTVFINKEGMSNEDQYNIMEALKLFTSAYKNKKEDEEILVEVVSSEEAEKRYEKSIKQNETKSSK